VAIVNPLTAAAMAGPSLVVRPLTEAIAFQISVLLPALATPHPLRDAMVRALQDTAHQTIKR
jgi:hypothetical protein